MFKKLSFSVVLAAAASGCFAAQKPYRFSAALQEDAVSTIVRTLTAAGHDPDFVDSRSGVVQTGWTNTANFCARHGGNGKVVQRYTATVTPSASSSDVVLRLDAKCCDASTVEFGDVQIRRGCEQMSHIFDFQQKELDELGARLRADLTGL